MPDNFEQGAFELNGEKFISIRQRAEFFQSVADIFGLTFHGLYQTGLYKQFAPKRNSSKRGVFYSLDECMEARDRMLEYTTFKRECTQRGLKTGSPEYYRLNNIFSSKDFPSRVALGDVSTRYYLKSEVDDYFRNHSKQDKNESVDNWSIENERIEDVPLLVMRRAGVFDTDLNDGIYIMIVQDGSAHVLREAKVSEIHTTH